MIYIYQIRNIVNNKVYIGQTVNEIRRKANHLFLLRTNSHHSYKLQNAYNKYGEENFIFEILEECSKDQLNDRELYYIQIKDSYNNGYNCNLGGQLRISTAGENNSQYGKTGDKSTRFKDYILQLDNNNNIIGRFGSFREAQRMTGIEFSAINYCCLHKRRKTAGGYRWMYETEYLNSQ